MQRKECVVFDFDGTLINCNSFRLFLRFLLFRLMLRRKFVLFSILICFILLKAFRIISHLYFKKKIMSLGAALTNEDIRVFSDILISHIRPEVMSEYLTFNGDRKRYLCICTAAPYLYMMPIFLYFKPDIAIAFGSPGMNLNWSYDNSGDRKLFNLSEILGYKIDSLAAMYSDHIDDLPLLQMAQEPILVAPSKKHRISLKNIFPNIRIIE